MGTRLHKTWSVRSVIPPQSNRNYVLSTVPYIRFRKLLVTLQLLLVEESSLPIKYGVMALFGTEYFRMLTFVNIESHSNLEEYNLTT